MGPDSARSSLAVRKASRTHHSKIRPKQGDGDFDSSREQDYVATDPSLKKGEVSLAHQTYQAPPKNAVNIIAKKRPPPMQIGFNELGIEPKRKVLYRNFHLVSQKVYLVEISRNIKKIFILLFPNFELPETYLHQVFAEKVAHKLMSDNDNLFETLVTRFYIKFSTLQIEGYHGKGPVRKYQSVPPNARKQVL